jgi:hypothetical protein
LRQKITAKEIQSFSQRPQRNLTGISLVLQAAPAGPIWHTNEETIYQNIPLSHRVEKTHQTMVAVPFDLYDMVLVKPALPAF